MLSHELRPGDDAIMLMTNEQHPAKQYERQIFGTCLVLFLIIVVWEATLLREPSSWLILPIAAAGAWFLDATMTVPLTQRPSMLPMLHSRGLKHRKTAA